MGWGKALNIPKHHGTSGSRPLSKIVEFLCYSPCMRQLMKNLSLFEVDLVAIVDQVYVDQNESAHFLCL